MASQHFQKKIGSAILVELKLFFRGKAMQFPFKAIWQEMTFTINRQSSNKCSQKRLSKASQRNHIKRLVREAYRKQKSLLIEKLLQEK